MIATKESAQRETRLVWMSHFGFVMGWLTLINFGAPTCYSQADAGLSGSKIKVGYFDVDATPPIGSQLAYSPTRSVVETLRCRGIVLLGSDRPIVLCAVDWLGIGNESNLVFRERLATAAGTDSNHVAVHTLHQHDAPWCDFSADTLAREHGASGIIFDSGFARIVLERAEQGVRSAVANAQSVTHVALGQGQVEQVASNRRILGPDGRVKAVRWTATKDPAVRAEPEGVIDPMVRSVSFFRGDERLVVLTYYATHPQSYYGKGDVNPDFPGMARNARQAATGVPHVHFCGAGGNVGAGKYNDGSPENRPVLAKRLEDGMRLATESEKRFPISTSDVSWKTSDVLMPVTERLRLEDIEKIVRDPARTLKERIYAATQEIWMRRCQAKDPVTLQCLRLGASRILHMPGELFVEYQLAAQQMCPDTFVAMAAYGDYAPNYIGTAIAYEQGGYETEVRSTLVAPAVEGVLIHAMQQVLEVEPKPWPALGIPSEEPVQRP
jgi:hypothetical protein